MAHKEIDLKNPKTNRKMPVLRMRNAENFLHCWDRDLSTPIAIFIRIRKESIPGGLIVSRQGRKNAGWRIDYFCVSEKSEGKTGGCQDPHGKSWVLIIVRLSWILIFETEKKCEYNARCIVKRDNLQFLIAMHLLL